jgi:glycosyltransferase involved in cell wall biosynthesis
VIDAFALVNARYPAWRLSLVGEGPLLDQLTRREQDRGVGQKVDFLGRVGDPYALYRRADVFVLASRYEGMPNAVLEAMSCGVPPVVSDCTAGALDYIEHETTGLIVPTDDSNALAAALGRLIDDRALRRRLGEAARERVSDLSFDRVAAIWDAMLYPKAIPASTQQGETASGSRNPVATRSP